MGPGVSLGQDWGVREVANHAGGGEGTTVGEQGALEGGGRERKEGCALLPETVSK